MNRELQLKNRVYDLMLENPKKLYSVVELVDIFIDHKAPGFKGTNVKGIDNILRNLRIKGLIFRHLDKDSSQHFLFAVKIDIEFIDHWVLNERMSKGVSTGLRVTQPLKKSKKGTLTKKEIQSMFATLYNMLASVEDESMKVIEEHETLEKEMNRIKNFMGKI